MATAYQADAFQIDAFQIDAATGFAFQQCAFDSDGFQADTCAGGALLWGPTGVEYMYLQAPYSLNMCTLQLVLPLTDELVVELC
jgi:hypothetical protein